MSNKIYDLEEQTFQFAKQVRLMCNDLTKTTANIEDTKQLIRASGSVGANYIEANESLGKKDFLMRIKICRKEAKECGYFVRLISETNHDVYNSWRNLHKESVELKKIFASILTKSS